jgi:hypothetical protein
MTDLVEGLRTGGCVERSRARNVCDIGKELGRQQKGERSKQALRSEQSLKLGKRCETDSEWLVKALAVYHRSLKTATLQAR